MSGWATRVWLCLLMLCCMPAAWAHKGSDAYLDVQGADTGAWTFTLAVAIKDLDGVLPLDADADGKVTWGEIKAATPAMQALLQAHARLDGAAGCGLPWAFAGLERRSDGAYVRWSADTRCDGARAFRYDLFRAQDATHRLIVTGRIDGRDLLSTLSPTSDTPLLLRAATGDAGAPADAAVPHSGIEALWVYLRMGVHHLLEGYDHLAFLLALVLPLRLAIRPDGTDTRTTWFALLSTVTAFTVGHSVTLVLATLGWTQASPVWVEPAIAVSIGVTAWLNLHPLRHVRTDVLALLFGMVHGFGFAGLLTEAAAPSGLLPWALAGFNIGVECGQLIAVASWVLLSQALLRQRWYGSVVVRGGSWMLIVLAAFWFWQRVL